MTLVGENWILRASTSTFYLHLEMTLILEELGFGTLDDPDVDDLDCANLILRPRILLMSTLMVNIGVEVVALNLQSTDI